MKITLNQIKEDWDSVKTVKLTPDEQLEIINGIDNIKDIKNFDNSQLENVRDFISMLTYENRLIFITSILDNLEPYRTVDEDNIRKFLGNYKDELLDIFDATASRSDGEWVSKMRLKK